MKPDELQKFLEEGESPEEGPVDIHHPDPKWEPDELASRLLDWLDLKVASFNLSYPKPPVNDLP